MTASGELGQDSLPPDPCAGRQLYVAGSGSFAIEVADWATDAGWAVAGLIEMLDDARVGAVAGGHPIVGDGAPATNSLAVVGIGGPRDEHWSRLAEHGWSPATIVHPRAHVSKTASLQDGCVIAPGAVVGARAAIGRHTLVSRGVLVGHHDRIGAFVSLMPGVNVGGNVSIGDRTFVGMGAVIANDTTVGVDATVGAGAVVLKDVTGATRVQGLPAREYDR